MYKHVFVSLVTYVFSTSAEKVKNENITVLKLLA